MASEGSLAGGYAHWRASRLGRITDAMGLREVMHRLSAAIAGSDAGRQLIGA